MTTSNEREIHGKGKSLVETADRVTESDGNFVQSLARGLAVIKAFDADDRELTLSDVARKTGLSRAAARRLLMTLVLLGYVRQQGRLFSLRPRVLELGYSYLSGIDLAGLAQPHLEALTRELQESSSVSVLDGVDVVYIARVPMKRIMTVSISIGTRFPAYATSMGRVLLSALAPDELDAYFRDAVIKPLAPQTVVDPNQLRVVVDRIGKQGWSLVDQELEEGLRSVAVPIHGPSGAVIAAMNVSTHERRASLDELQDQFLPALLRAAEMVEADLSTSRF